MAGRRQKGLLRAIPLYSKAAVEILSAPVLSLSSQTGTHQEVMPTGHRSLPNPQSDPHPTTDPPCALLAQEGGESENCGASRPHLQDDAITSNANGGRLELAAGQGGGVNVTEVPVRALKCNSCCFVFSTREEQVEHYRLDWHKYNLKKILKGLPPVNQEEFEEVAGDLSSISGSESDPSQSDKEPEEEIGTSEEAVPSSHSPLVHFTTHNETGVHLYGLYRSVLTGMKRDGVSLEAIRAIKNEQTWIVLMRSGGHFAGAVFRGNTMETHKTFHRYTVRAKRGTAQSVRDGQSGGHKPKSAGASLRRYNEASLAQEIQDLLVLWRAYVQETSAVFLRTPKYSKAVFIGEDKSPFSKNDPRLRMIPFITRRPTLKEVQRVHSKLACIYHFPLANGCEADPKERPSSTNTARKPATVEESLTEANISMAEKDSDSNSMRQSVIEEIISLEEVEDVSMTDDRRVKERVNKKSRKKCIPNPQDDIPDNDIRSLLDMCSPGCASQENIASRLTQQLQGMGLVPLGQPNPPESSPEQGASSMIRPTTFEVAGIDSPMADCSVVTTDPSVPATTPDPSVPATTPDPSVPATTTDPSVPVTTTDPSVPVKTTDPSVPATTPDPSVPATTTDPSVPVTTTDPSVPVKTTDPSVPATTSDPNVPATTTDPSVPATTPDPSMPATTPDPSMPATTPDSSVPATTLTHRDTVIQQLNTLWNGTTVLHTAAASGCVQQVSLLLLYGADPAIKNKFSKTPYTVSKNKMVRDAFRRFMALYPMVYDYSLSQIPSPLTDDMERERREKVNEKKRAQKKIKKGRERELKSAHEEVKISLSREKKVAELSDREKRAMAAERRLSEKLPTNTSVIRAGKCSFCEKSLVGLVPFERLSFKYCRMACLKEHREALSRLPVDQ